MEGVSFEYIWGGRSVLITKVKACGGEMIGNEGVMGAE